MSGENHVIRHGRLVRDPELKTGTKDGKDWSKADFTIAVNNSYPKTDASFYPCTIFGKRAEALCKFFKKGSEIVVYGEFEQEHWEKDGEKKSMWKLNATNFDFCGKGGAAESDTSIEAEPSGGEDLPF